MSKEVRSPEGLSGPGRVVVASYNQIRLNPPELMHVVWDAVVLDECHCCRNPLSQLSVTVSKLQARFRLALSGTPVQNEVRGHESRAAAVVYHVLCGFEHNINGTPAIKLISYRIRWRSCGVSCASSFRTI